MKVAPGGPPSKNKIVNADVIEGLERSEKFKDAKKKFDWFEEWITRKDKWGWRDSDERPFIA
jgi:hypothetical protein